MEGYLGDTIVDQNLSKYHLYTPSDWVMLYIEMYTGYDGDHHKTWLLDQIARIMKGTKVIVTRAEWENGHSEERFKLDEASEEYHEWVKEMKAGEDGADTYEYNTGVAS